MPREIIESTLESVVFKRDYFVPQVIENGAKAFATAFQVILLYYII